MTLKRFFACGLPRGPNMRIRLLAGAPVALASCSKPTVALMVSRSSDLPVSTSPLNMASMPSRKSASANFLSALMCCCTRSLNFFDLAMLALPSTAAALAPLVVLPAGAGRRDIARLPLLAAAGQQDNQRLAVSPEIDPVAWPEVDPIFEH